MNEDSITPFQVPMSANRSGSFKKNVENSKLETKKNSRSEYSYDIFLGGSCNPTTWRKDVAIPYLQEVDVSFYNPQVDHWSQDLIEIEHAVKQNAKILFFVIDNQTRNVVTCIEIANFAGNHTNIILVILPQDEEGELVVAGERISSKEFEDIKEAQAVLHHICSNQKVLIFDNIPYALSKAVQILKNETQQNNCTREDSNMNRKICVSSNMFDTKECENIGNSDKLFQTASAKITDICLVGESDDNIKWREDIAIPMIKKSNLSYYLKATTDLSILLNTRTMLLVVPNNSRALTTMILAAYCISKSCKMVLCTQNLNEDNCIVHGEKLTKTAIKDYQRGRMYLADLASKNHVPFSESITEAIEMAIEMSL